MFTLPRFVLLFPVVMFLLPPASPEAALSVVLDSLSGKARVQRAGTTKWKPVKLNEKLFNNDVVRIDPEGYGRLQWPDESVVYLKGGSQILVNIGPPKGAEKLLNYATVFAGSVFFVIKKALPANRKQNIQIYTPTTVISIRGTSFSLDVTPESGVTAVKVINGTVRVSCIAKQASAYVSAPFKTTVKKMTDPITTAPMHDSEIKALKTWVPEKVVDHEITLQLARGRRDQMIISGRMEKKCTITPFINSSKYDGTWDLQHKLAEMLAERLGNVSPHCKVTVSDSAPPAPAEATKKRGQQYVISGTISFFDIVNHAAITVRADEYKERAIARVQIDLTLFDVTGNTELLQTTVRGEFSGKKTNENSMKTIGEMEFSLENREFAKSLLGTALQQALDQAVEKLSKTMFQ